MAVYTHSEDIIHRAISFAAVAHAGQVRKTTGLPYIYHPLAVGRALFEYGFSPEVVAAGILHDTIEDTDTTYDQLEQEFGTYVADLVQMESEPDKSDTWENRKMHTIEHMKTAPFEAIAIACADKRDNVRGFLESFDVHGEDLWQNFKRGKEQQEWYHRSLVGIFQSRRAEFPEAAHALIDSYAEDVNSLFL